MPTPWVTYRTPRPVAFDCIPSNLGLIVTAGDDPERHASCLLREQSGRMVIEILPPGSDEARIIRPYHIQLSRWTQRRHLPRINLHPLALPHLLVSGQVPRRDCLEMFATTGRNALFMRMGLETRCDLLTQLGVRGAFLAFRTDYDLEVVKIQED
jgi:hypothetical protein